MEAELGTMQPQAKDHQLLGMTPLHPPTPPPAKSFWREHSPADTFGTSVMSLY